MTGCPAPRRSQILLQQCTNCGAADERSIKVIADHVNFSLEPRSNSLVSAPDYLTKPHFIKTKRIKDKFAGNCAGIKHDQVSPKVRNLLNDTTFEGVLIDCDEGERLFTSWFNIPKWRSHSKASSHSGSTCSSVFNLSGKSLTKREFFQPVCEHFSIGDTVHRFAGTAPIPAEEFAAADTMLREARVELIRHSEIQTLEQTDDRR